MLEFNICPNVNGKFIRILIECATDISISCLKKIQDQEINEYKLKINPTKKVS
jgi:hypothetical protein